MTSVEILVTIVLALAAACAIGYSAASNWPDAYWEPEEDEEGE